MIARLAPILGLILIGCGPLQRKPDSSEISRALVLIDQGVDYLRRGSLEQAEASFLIAHELAYLPQALDGLGCVALRQKEYFKAEGYFLQVKQQFPDYHHVDGNIAALYREVGRDELAEGWYLRALKNNADNFRFRNNFGVFLAEKKEYLQAQEEFERAGVLVNDRLIYDNRQVLIGSGERIYD